MANFKLTQTKEQIQADLDLLDKNTATAGQVLTANGTGGASWQNASGGSGGGTVGFTINCSLDLSAAAILYFADGTNNTITNTNATFNNVVMFNITKTAGGTINCPVLYINQTDLAYANSFMPSANKNYFVLGDGAILLGSGGGN